MPDLTATLRDAIDAALAARTRTTRALVDLAACGTRIDMREAAAAAAAAAAEADAIDALDAAVAAVEAALARAVV